MVHFTRRFAGLSPQNFIKRYIVDKIHPKEIFVGDDFRFGHGRGGTLDYFKEEGKKYGFVMNVFKVVSFAKAHHKKIGSTWIRQLISEGKLSQAKKLLGRNVSILGEVVKGDGRGKTLGFPTANLHLCKKIILPVGVYAVNVKIGENKFPAMANVGYRPSFKKTNNALNIEVHIFNFHKNIYGKEILIEFMKKIRSEKKFLSREQLVQQLQRDKIKAMAYLQ